MFKTEEIQFVLKPSHIDAVRSPSPDILERSHANYQVGCR